ncbi:ATP-dependent helicase HrpB [Caldichromatium japonicum]|uniref:ATP-dependent helicase HrpB n=1 Tax=Caldichromatium japonicum TaxID=2699430 RepID=A0A6G7VEB7_9GAMM|nr:ATP-dependent helicase HrpB [Caldichromatium japonicum]QIK38137.1 ATP-dependent helicase HrpB [Caldichromatium japonicum]
MKSGIEPFPIWHVLDGLRAALHQGHAVLQAPTGSGKSTVVPIALLDEPWLAGQRLLLLQPRRPAARLIAAHLAKQLGEPLGKRVGYQIRFERCLGPDTRIEVLTEGILTRRIQSDPSLDGVGLVIFDEFHERHLVSDLGLALTLDSAQQLRPDLRILVMSATLEAEPLVRLLGKASLIRAEGRSFPVEIRHAERALDPEPVRAVAAAVRQALIQEDGDILAFLPGVREIEQVRAALASLIEPGLMLLPLHGALSTAEQDRALRPDPERRRVILATDLAETSLTIEGIRIVVDSGLARKPRFDPATGLTRLITEPIPRASAEQRAGRAGRLGPGICYRLWTRAQESGRPEQRIPEILVSDLASLVLELALWGVKDPEALTWLDVPPAPAWAQAIAVLQALDALDARGAITPLGRALAELPVHPRLGAMLLRATPGERQLAADLCALVSERDPWQAAPGLVRPADLGLRLAALNALRAGTTLPLGIDRQRLATVERAARQLARLARRQMSPSSPMVDQAPRSPGALLSLAYPDRIAQRRAGADARYLLASGRGAGLAQDDLLAGEPYLVVAALDDAGREGRIQLAAALTATEIRAELAGHIVRQREVFWDEARATVSARLTTRLGEIVLDAQPMAPDNADEANSLLLAQIHRRFTEALNWSASARQLQGRILLAHRHDPEGGWPDLSESALKSQLADWLGPWLVGKTRLDEVQEIDLVAILLERLTWKQRQRLDRLFPVRIQTPAGTSRPIDYAQGEPPILAVPVQELFGWCNTPSICNGRVPLLLHLLSPARRPIQVTQDLAGFWARGYAEVRKELRGRYPKHQWPEDPTQAQARPGGIKQRDR